MKREVSKDVKFLNVTYKNDFNNVINKAVGVTDSNLMYGILGLIKNSTEEELTLSYDYIRSLSGRYVDENNPRTYNFLKNWVLKMDNTVRLEESDEKGNPYRFVSFPLFTFMDNNKSEGFFTIKINDAFDIKSVLTELDSCYTTFDFDTYISLDSKYSKALYRLLMQWRATGVYKVKMDKFRLLMCVPESMTTKRFMYEVVNPSIKEINEKSNLIEKLSVSKKNLSNREIDTLTFFFETKDSTTKEVITESNNKEKTSKNIKKKKDKGANMGLSEAEIKVLQDKY